MNKKNVSIFTKKKKKIKKTHIINLKNTKKRLNKLKLIEIKKLEQKSI